MMSASFKDRNVLIVGGAGFVGSNLVKLILREDPKSIMIVDNLLSSDPFNVPDDARVSFIPRSINDETVLQNLSDDLDYAFHLACFHGNQSSIADPMMDHENNTLTSLKLFNRLKDIKNLKKVVYAAAGCAVAAKTYDSPEATKEDAPVSLVHDSPYSISKLIGELYGNYFHLRYDLPLVKARFQNVYGPGEILGAGQYRGTVHTVWRNVTPTFIFKALHQEALGLDNGGDASRDFIFVEDMARGLMACALRGEKGEIYNLASGVETTIRELAEMINEIAENPTAPDLHPKRDWDRSGKRFGDPSKAQEKLGFKAQVGVKEGLEKTIAWTKENMLEIKRCIRYHKKQVPEVAKYID